MDLYLSFLIVTVSLETILSILFVIHTIIRNCSLTCKKCNHPHHPLPCFHGNEEEVLIRSEQVTRQEGYKTKQIPIKEMRTCMKPVYKTETYYEIENVPTQKSETYNDYVSIQKKKWVTSHPNNNDGGYWQYWTEYQPISKTRYYTSHEEKRIEKTRVIPTGEEEEVYYEVIVGYENIQVPNYVTETIYNQDDLKRKKEMEGSKCHCDTCSCIGCKITKIPQTIFYGCSFWTCVILLSFFTLIKFVVIFGPLWFPRLYLYIFKNGLEIGIVHALFIVISSIQILTTPVIHLFTHIINTT